MTNFNKPLEFGFIPPSLGRCAYRKPLHIPPFKTQTVRTPAVNDLKVYAPTPFFKLDVKKTMPVIKLHSGRTDGAFGHNVRNRPEIAVFQPSRTVSGQTTQSIERDHYHHGLQAHPHPNGICPYSKTTTRVEIKNPQSGKSFFIGDKLIVRVDVLNASRVELLINNELCDEKSGLMASETVLFRQYELTADDLGDTDITVIAYVDEDGIEQAAINTVVVHVAYKPVTATELEAFGWENTSQKEIDSLNNILQIYDIISPDSVCLFLATCGHESGKGKRTLEYLNSDGTTVGDYPPEQRGAGYIQLTWRSTHMQFLAEKKSGIDSFDGTDTATYIAENYPWEAAAWFWASADAKDTSDASNSKISLNDYAATYGSSLGVFLITQFYVNGSISAISKDKDKIRDGTIEWSVESGKVIIDGAQTGNAPNNWVDRERNYLEAISIFK